MYLLFIAGILALSLSINIFLILYLLHTKRIYRTRVYSSKEIKAGKAIQEQFIPLDTDDIGNSSSTFRKKINGTEIFCYYKSADQLSGDYFDFIQLDYTHTAFIKCDISGHGIPASLIMIQVATLFSASIKQLDTSNPENIKLHLIVRQINDIIESRNFKDRFAAFTIGIINSITGDCLVSSAGDNILHIYKNNTHKMTHIKLDDTPAAGIFHSSLIEQNTPYSTTHIKLESGDILYLYTDGIEESSRSSDNPENRKDITEYFGKTRIDDIINSCNNKTQYTISFSKDRFSAKQIIFDFTNTQGKAEDSVMALATAEKLFRLHPDKGKFTSKVPVDSPIDAFMKEHLKNYNRIIRKKQILNSQLYYCTCYQDIQKDDLTVIAIKKN